jgi:predicted MPP superfamily phosphohydrolase
LGSRAKRHTFLTKPALAVFVAASVGIVCFLYGIFVEPYWLQVNYITIHTDKLRQTAFRVVHFSDTHTDKDPRLEPRLARAINSLKPDCIVFTGDTINEARGLPLFKQTLGAMQAPYGKFAVQGNIDDWYWKGVDLFGATGFVLLDKKKQDIVKGSEAVTVYGLNYKYVDRVDKVLGKSDPLRFNILLFHSPRLIHSLKDFPVDLYLCGHTHGGQVALPVYGALVTLSKFGKRYESGKYRVGNTMLYVNRGIGMEGKHLRIRFFARPEITVFDIVPDSRKAR